MPLLADLLEYGACVFSPKDEVLYAVFQQAGVYEESGPGIGEKREPLMPLAQFVAEAWAVVDPEPYVHGWHIDAICEHLEAVSRREIRDLLINVPPRSSKSLVTSVCWHPWVWSWWPSARFIYASYSERLSLVHALLARDLIGSTWYQDTFKPKWKIRQDERTKGLFSNTVRGFRFSTSVGALATGMGGDFICGDDLHKIDENESETRAELNAAKSFWLKTMPSRVTNPKQSSFVVVGQRVSEDDISGELLSQKKSDYLCIPMEYDPPGPGVPVTSTVLGWMDPRTEPGELLCPERYGEAELAPLKLRLGADFYAQYQQRPTSDATTLFKRSDWRRYETMPEPEWFDVIVMSWDFAVKNEETSDFCCGQVWGVRTGEHGKQLVLLDFVLDRMDFPESVEAVRTLSAKWPTCYGKLIEDKANGSPVYQVLRGQVFGLIPINPQPLGNKRARAQAVAYLHRAGQCWVPADSLRSWGSQYIEAMARLDPWDVVDATSQAWSNLAMPSPVLDAIRAEASKRQAWQHKIGEAQRRERRGASLSHI